MANVISDIQCLYYYYKLGTNQTSKKLLPLCNQEHSPYSHGCTQRNIHNPVEEQCNYFKSNLDFIILFWIYEYLIIYVNTTHMPDICWTQKRILNSTALLDCYQFSYHTVPEPRLWVGPPNIHIIKDLLKHGKGPRIFMTQGNSRISKSPSIGPVDSAEKARDLGSLQVKMYGRGHTVRIPVSHYTLHCFYF